MRALSWFVDGCLLVMCSQDFCLVHANWGRVEGKGGRKRKRVKGEEGKRKIEKELSYVFGFYDSNLIMNHTLIT